MPKFRLTVAYDGTDYVGWQRQASGVSIQGLLEEALADLDGRPVPVAAAGRTDAGVHARGQVAAVTLSRDFDAATLVRAVNIRLPAAVRILAAEIAADEFHPQFLARQKHYRYRIWNADVLNPFERQYAWHVPVPLSADAMRDAAALLAGTHDFAAFQGTGSDTQTTTRSVAVSAVQRDADLVVYDVAADGFLRHMVRNIVGTLVEVGRGKRPPAWVADVLASRDRSAGGPTAPPQGLFLMAVGYDE